MRFLFSFILILVALFSRAQSEFIHQLQSTKQPWTDKAFDDAPEQFQFAIVSDRTGGHRAGIFGDALHKLNLMHPEFVMSVGDLVEGYTRDTALINTQWAEFDSILATLNMKFFALPGNHDISNNVMRAHWLEKYGASYYHFRYKDVLFLAFDSNDGDGVLFSEEQLAYFEQAIADNQDVKWTLIFMHHPIWNYREFNGFQKIETALKDRPYTVFAGHTHRYFKSRRQGQNYYVLASTGGGSQLRGPRLGEFDHVTWVTMTPEGPELVHLQLSGIIEEDVLNEQTAPIALALHNATQMKSLVLQQSDTSALIYLRISNDLKDNNPPESSGLFSEGQQANWAMLDQVLRLEGRFYHNHHLDPETTELNLQIPADSTIQIVIPVKLSQEANPDTIDPLELDWALEFESDPLGPAFKLSGILEIEPTNIPHQLEFTPMDVFLEEYEVELTTAFEDLQIRYTLDGGSPGINSRLYTGPITIKETTTLKVRYFDALGQAMSAIAEKQYRKVSPMAPTKVKKRSLVPGMRYAYYEGDFTSELPDFDQLVPLRTGIALHGSPDSAEHRLDHFGFTYEGYIEVPQEGVYTFYTRSDDGSQLFIHDNLVVDNNGSHSTQVRKGHIALQAGLHPIRVTYFEDFLGEALEIGYEAEGLPRQIIPFANLFHKK